MFRKCFISTLALLYNVATAVKTPLIPAIQAKVHLKPLLTNVDGFSQTYQITFVISLSKDNAHPRCLPYAPDVTYLRLEVAVAIVLHYVQGLY